jgi:hypothetical protein
VHAVHEETTSYNRDDALYRPSQTDGVRARDGGVDASYFRCCGPGFDVVCCLRGGCAVQELASHRAPSPHVEAEAAVARGLLSWQTTTWCAVSGTPMSGAAGPAVPPGQQLLMPPPPCDAAGQPLAVVLHGAWVPMRLSREEGGGRRRAVAAQTHLQRRTLSCIAWSGTRKPSSRGAGRGESRRRPQRTAVMGACVYPREAAVGAC